MENNIEEIPEYIKEINSEMFKYNFTEKEREKFIIIYNRYYPAFTRNKISNTSLLVKKYYNLLRGIELKDTNLVVLLRRILEKESCIKPKPKNVISNVDANKKLKDMQKLAENRNGDCLSKEYINPTTNMRWRCVIGHEFELSEDNVKCFGRWCPICSSKTYSNEKLTKIKKLAELNGCECLSDKYTNSHTKMKFRCKKGHKWEAPMDLIRKQSWFCPYCKNKKINK